MNIVETLMKLLQGSVGRQIAGMLGLSEDKAAGALQAALPALLAALTGAASSSDGARKLATAVEDADEGLLGNLGNVLGGQGAALADQGNSILGSLLSGGGLGSLGSVLARFTGLGSSSITSLLGGLAPIVLSFLKRETKSSGFDPAALTGLLQGQKDNIAKALPAGLGDLLGGVPGLEQFSALARGAGDAVSSAANRTTAAARSAAPEASVAKWLVPLLVAVALGWLAWSYWLKPQDAPIVNRETPSAPRLDAATTVTAGRISDEIARQVEQAKSGAQDVFADATTAFTGVTDADSAAEAAEQLPKLTDRLTQLQELSESIPQAQRQSILDLIVKSRGTLLALIDKVMKIPGAAAVLEPHVEKLKSALALFGE